MIQILVLQNYLVSRLLTILFITISFGQSAHLLSLRKFFGNAKSICSFVQTMFDEPQDLNDHHDLPPIPKHLIIDLSIVTGIDSSAGKCPRVCVSLLHTALIPLLHLTRNNQNSGRYHGNSRRLQGFQVQDDLCRSSKVHSSVFDKRRGTALS